MKLLYFFAVTIGFVIVLRKLVHLLRIFSHHNHEQ